MTISISEQIDIDLNSNDWYVRYMAAVNPNITSTQLDKALMIGTLDTRLLLILEYLKNNSI